MRRTAFLLLSALLLILSVSSLAAQDQQPASTTALQVVDSNPFTGQELGAQSDIVLYFNRPLNCDTPQTACGSKPSVQGTISCNDSDSSLHFTPSQPYTPATPYTVAVTTALQAQDNSKLDEPLKLDFNSLGYLTVSSFLPADGSTDI